VYDLEEGSFALSDILMKSRYPLWRGDAIVQLLYGDEVVDVAVGTGEPKVAATFPIERGADWFYGMFDDKALVLQGREVKLGGRTLAECADSRISSVATSGVAIFVAASTENVVGFDYQGREVARTNPGRLIQLGPVGEDRNTVYGLAGTVLVRLALEDGQLSVRDVCDLEKSMGGT
jgi:hypothetical protein